MPCRAASSSGWRSPASLPCGPACCCWTSRPLTWTRTVRRSFARSWPAWSSSSGLTLVMVEHRVAEALALVDRVVALQAGGGIVADGRRVRRVRAPRRRAWPTPAYGCPDRRLPAPPSRHRPASETMLLAEQVAYRYPGAAAAGPGTHRPPGAIRRGVGHHRAERQRQVDARPFCWPACYGRRTASVMAGEALARGRGHDPIWRLAGPRAGAAHRHRLPGSGASVPDRQGARRAAARARMRQASTARRPGSGPTSCWLACTLRTWPTPTRSPCRAARSVASRWQPRWPPRRRC